MSWKNHTDIGDGVIDADYRGEIGIVMFNHSDVDLFIKEKDRVAQLIIEKNKHITSSGSWWLRWYGQRM